MSNTNTGGPAFPHIDSGCGRFEAGMTMRDYFASKAMQGLVTDSENTAMLYSEQVTDEPNLAYFVAKQSYALADAMLKARQV